MSRHPKEHYKARPRPKATTAAQARALLEPAPGAVSIIPPEPVAPYQWHVPTPATAGIVELRAVADEVFELICAGRDAEAQAAAKAYAANVRAEAVEAFIDAGATRAERERRAALFDGEAEPGVEAAREAAMRSMQMHGIARAVRERRALELRAAIAGMRGDWHSVKLPAKVAA